MSLTRTPMASSARSTSVASPSPALTGTSSRRSGSFGTMVPVANGLRALIAACVSAPAASVSAIRCPPRDDLSSAGAPSAMTLPPSMTAIRLASWSASSRYCVVSSSVVPPATRPRTMSHISARALGSRPVVGSSRNSTAGFPIRLAARSRRRRMPPEYVLTARFAASVRSKRPSRSSARRRAAFAVSLLSCPIMTRLARPVQIFVERRVLAGQSDRAANRRGFRHHIAAEHPRAPPVRAQQRREHADRGGLTRAVRAEQSVDGARWHRQVEPVPAPSSSRSA